MRPTLSLVLVAAWLSSVPTSVSATLWNEPVYRDSQNREWLNATVFGGFSPSRMREYCDLLTGACAGTFVVGDSALDLAGFFWAGRDEVRELFYDVGGLASGELDDFQYQDPLHSAAADRFFAAFAQNGPAHGPRTTRAILRSPMDVGADGRGSFYIATVEANRTSGVLPQEPFELFSLTDSIPLPLNYSERLDYTGNLLYRVPEPGTLGLLCLGLAGIGFARRKRMT